MSEHVREGSKKIVYDKFHIAKHLGEAVDKVRRKENRTLRAGGDDRLTGTRYDWLRNPAAMEPADRRAFAELRRSGLKTARAWALKETAMALFNYQYERPARPHPRLPGFLRTYRRGSERTRAALLLLRTRLPRSGFPSSTSPFPAQQGSKILAIRNGYSCDPPAAASVRRCFSQMPRELFLGPRTASSERGLEWLLEVEAGWRRVHLRSWPQ